MAGKVCTKCKEYKLYSEFHLDRSTKDGHRAHCKFCISIYRKERLII